MKIFIGGAWPYANGSLHLGHVAALLPGDVIARYFRLKGEEVLYVSGSDCHGTPISVRANKEGVSPKTIVDKYHKEFLYCFNKLGFSYDLYSRTDDEYHKVEVQKIIKEIYEKEYIYEKEVEQLHCEFCDQFLPDRFVEGNCPICKSSARGDQCDSCGTLLDPIDLSNRTCKICGKEPKVKKNKQLFFALSKFQEELEEYLKSFGDEWRINAVNNTSRYLREGLKDRALSRDIDLGINIPIKDYEDKKIYVWMDAVLGYFTLSKKWSEDNKKDLEEFWDDTSLSYFVHGKDNIPFHSIIFPALLSAAGYNKKPNRIISSEYMTLEGKKISTSNNWAIWIKDIIEKYNPDSLRYFFIINGPEGRDTDFSFREFINSNNGELLGAYGNLVNRTLVFVTKYFNNNIPNGNIDGNIEKKIVELYDKTSHLIKGGNLKVALEEIFKFIRFMNKYFDENTPWIYIKEDKNKCEDTIYNCIFSILNIANLLHPFLPFSSEKVKAWLGYEGNTWSKINIKEGSKLGNYSILFERLDKNLIDKELNKLKTN
ncbi:methionine--tRNA ligase [Clostridium sp.]|uniref:methionine--tRNA ligase n=1 Tax=Clostridium sp. TaxID=1506 RepID=UPI0034647C02